MIGFFVDRKLFTQISENKFACVGGSLFARFIIKVTFPTQPQPKTNSLDLTMTPSKQQNLYCRSIDLIVQER